MRTRPLSFIVVLIGATAAGPADALPAFSSQDTVGAAVGGRATLVRVTTGHHPAFDRMVFRFRGGRPGWSTRFVAQPVQDGSGDPVAIVGRRYLAMSFTPADSPAFSYLWRTTPRYRTLKQIRSTGDFEAVVTMTAGLRYRAPYRVFGLNNPYRVVVDVRH